MGASEISGIFPALVRRRPPIWKSECPLIFHSGRKDGLRTSHRSCIPPHSGARSPPAARYTLP